jgi:tetratricopeptide (TPR) repeat protein
MAMAVMRRHHLGWAVIAAALAGGPAARADDRSCCGSTPGAPGSEEKGWTMTSEELAKLGEVKFPISCAAAVQRPFAQGVAMLHSFWFDEATRVFSRIAATDPSCAMAHWGVAMSLYHPLWSPPTQDMLARGAAEVDQARAGGAKTARERDYIAAIAAFYTDWSTRDHAVRAIAYLKAMEQVHLRYADDTEAALFHALALLANASSADPRLTDRRTAGAIAEKIFARQPEHPGAAHYIIHAYDDPRLASRALAAARRYARIAPSVPHALHMPSHTFTQVGSWQESVDSNVASKAAAHTYGVRTLMTGAWEEELHAMDYLGYAYLQLGDDGDALAIVRELATIRQSSPERSRKSACAFDAIPARYAIERRRWKEAAALEPRPGPFPGAAALTYFARGYARARLGDVAGAHADLERLTTTHARLLSSSEEGAGAAAFVEIQRLAVAAWIAHAEKRDDEAVKLMRGSADLDDATDGDAVMPGPIVPARELLGDLYLELGQPRAALTAFRTALARAPLRFNGLLGAARAAQAAGDHDQAAALVHQLDALCRKNHCVRPELAELQAATERR